MCEAAERRVLHRHVVRVERVDLDHPAEIVRLVAVVLRGVGAGGAGVEARELVGAAGGDFPIVAAGAGRHAVAGVLARQRRAAIALVAVAEVAGPVLLARHVGVPRRHAVGAVVQRAARAGAVRAVLGAQQRVAARRAGDLHRRRAGDAAVARIVHDRPATVGALADTHDAHAVRVDLLQHLIVRPLAVHQRQAAAVDRDADGAGMHEARLDVFVVQHEEAVGAAALVRLAALDREEVHAVMVRADRRTLLGAGHLAEVLAGRLAVQRRALRQDDLHRVAFRDHDGVGVAHRDRLEADHRTAGGRCALRHGRLRRAGADEAGDGSGDAAHEHAAAAEPRLGDLAEGRVGGGVRGDFVPGVEVVKAAEIIRHWSLHGVAGLQSCNPATRRVNDSYLTKM